MAVNPWVGYEASAYVVGTVAQDQLGCTVNYKDLKEDVSWQGFGTGEVDVVIEDWGHPDLEKKFFEEQGDGTAMDIGPQGNVGIIGWYVPPWLAKEHPDILDYKNLNKYASDFATSESGGTGPVPRRRPVVRPVRRGDREQPRPGLQGRLLRSEAASIEAFRKAEENKEFLIGYFYEPQYFMAEVPLEKVALPPYTDGCQDDPAEVACDYPETELKKIVGTEWAAADSTAVDLVQNFTWTNDDQNVVAGYIAVRRHVPRGRGRQVGRREPGQGGRLARLTLFGGPPPCDP